ncbi:MAG: hypothetical protein HN395_06915 [Methylococcales bacterium]|nr:hypothetical protein [Methylococcales bacterium]MBT3816585.1 hypothetical protein [Methylococcales bacterium]
MNLYWNDQYHPTMIFRKTRKIICKKSSIQETMVARKEPSGGVRYCFTSRTDDQKTQISTTTTPNIP